MAGYHVAGIYSAAAQITEGCALFPMAFLAGALSAAGAVAKARVDPFRQQFERLFLGAIWVGFAVSLSGLTTMAPYHPPALWCGLRAGRRYSRDSRLVGDFHLSLDYAIGLRYCRAANLAGGSADRRRCDSEHHLELRFHPSLRRYWFGLRHTSLASLLGFPFNLAHPRTRPIFALQLRAFLLAPPLRPIILGARKAGGVSVSRLFAAEQ